MKNIKLSRMGDINCCGSLFKILVRLTNKTSMRRWQSSKDFLKGKTYMDTWGKSILSRGKEQCKGPEARM